MMPTATHQEIALTHHPENLIEDLCPLCRRTSVPQFEKHGIWIRECSGCGHRFAIPDAPDQHVQQVYGDDYFFNGGAGYDDYLSEAGILVSHGRRYGRLLKRHGAGTSLLDVGAAAGLILDGLVKEGFEGCGVEPNETMARFAQTELGLDVTASAFEDFETDRQFDVVTIVQVMGHFIDPHDALERVSRLLKPQGICLVETWNVGSWTARLSGQNWHEYSPPSVLHWYTPESLTTLFAHHGLEAVSQGRPTKKVSVGHTRSLLQHVKATSRLASIAAKALSILPPQLALPYPSEDLFWMTFRRV